MKISDEKFNQIISRAMDDLPQEYIKELQNVMIVIADKPSPEQIRKMGINNSLLLGLYEGVPLTMRGSGWSGLLPDKITLFKDQICRTVQNDKQLFNTIKRTLWHEIAHYYGLDHNRIAKLQNKNK